MTHEEYRKLLLDILEQNCSDEEKEKQLNQIYQIKPVDPLWNAVKARTLLKSGRNPTEIFGFLRNLVNMDCPAEGDIEGNRILQELDAIVGDIPISKYREYEIAQSENDLKYLEKRLEDEKRQEQLFLENENAEGLRNEYLADCKIVSNYILERYVNFINGGEHLPRQWIEEIPNFGFLKEAIDKKKDCIFCVSKESEQTEIYILGLVLARMGCKVSVITLPALIEIEEPINMQETVAVSMDNITTENGMQFIPAVELICDGSSLGNNVGEIINSLTGGTKGNKLFVLLASSCYMEELAATETLRKNLQNLYIQTSEWKKNNITFGWVGSYLAYIGEIYHMDAEAAIHKTSQCRFSVVIPARNSCATLRHTLRTCLNQRYRGSYEIVISDNSSDGNTEVYRMVRELNDERIKYFRTPRELHLPKSFEYAFLKASGEYIFSVGSDDALLPWTLEVLDDVTQRYPNEEVIYWERGFYAWPGFNGGQENQFVIPRRYQKGQYNENYISSVSFLTTALENLSYMYAMPLLYINSMFKRSYFDTLLTHTGRLWDGICQDLYMGVITSLIVPRILCLQYPLSIAGMSSGSVGATSNTAITELDAGTKFLREAWAIGNIGGFAMSRTEMLFPEITTDVSSFYNCILRAVARGLLPERILWDKDGIDSKEWFLNCYRTLDKKDVYFNLKVQRFRFAAMKHGEEFLKWFDETIYKEAVVPVVFGEKNRTGGKTYQEKEGESIILDASKRDVHNVYEASLLFEKLTGL